MLERQAFQNQCMKEILMATFETSPLICNVFIA